VDRAGRENELTRILITGAAGFIASHLIRYIQRVRPDWEIVGLDRLDEAGALARVPAGVKFVWHDLKSPIRTDAVGADALQHRT
jgi:nucleoside-diphosphate-sugar epimerase